MTATPATLEHAPLRPGWDCTVCAQPWPCAPAKVQLVEEYRDNVTSLAVYLSSQMADAIDEAARDHNWNKVDQLYGRFLGWVRQPPGRQHPSGGH